MILHADLGAVARCCCGWIRRCSACFAPPTGAAEFVRHVGEIWLVVGVGALLFRTVHLFFLKDVQTGLVWLTKILTDPFNDVKTYCEGAALLDARRADRSHGRRRSPPRLKHFLEHAAPDGLIGELLHWTTTSRRAACPWRPTRIRSATAAKSASV